MCLSNVLTLLSYIFSEHAGKVSMEDVKRGCSDAGIKFTKQELDHMFAEADLNGDGYIDLDEFTKIMLRTNLF